MLRTWIRRYLGTTTLEETMATVLDALQQLAAQQQAASAAQLTSFTNLQGAVQRLETAVRDGEVSPEIQAALGDLKAGFDTMLTAAQTADDGYEPTPEPEQPAEPVDETPAPVEGDTDADDSGTTSRRR